MFIKKVILFCVFVLVYPLVSQGNDGTPAAIYEIIQQSRSACITIMLSPYGGPGRSDEYDLVREKQGLATKIVQDTIIGNTEACEVRNKCQYTYPECETNPELCFDCNGDGTPECKGNCETLYYYTIADVCLKNGDYKYTLYSGISFMRQGYIDMKQINDDEPCYDTASVCGECVSLVYENHYEDSKESNDENDDFLLDDQVETEKVASDDDNDSGCGCQVATGSMDPTLFLVMICIGFLALLVGRKTRPTVKRRKITHK